MNASGSQTRNVVIDWCKAIAIWIMVLQHMNFPIEFKSLVYQFFIPVLFLISGYLENDLSVGESVKKGVVRLLIPYAVLYILSYGMWILSYIRHQELYFEGPIQDAVVKPLMGLVAGIGYQTGFSTTVNAPLWFLVGVFVCKVANAAIYSFSGRKPVVYAAFVLVFIPVTLLIKSQNIDLLLSIDSAVLAMPIYAAGFALRRFVPEEARVRLCKIVSGPWFLIFAGITIAISIVNGRMDVNSFRFGSSVFLFYVSALTGALSVYSLASRLARVRAPWIASVSSGTVVILAFHQYVFKVLMIPVRIEVSWLFYMIEVMISILTVIVLIPVIQLVAKKMPILMGWRSYSIPVFNEAR